MNLVNMKLWHMPHGISPPHSAPRSGNCYSLPWDPTTSLPVSTATHPSYNINTLSYKLSSPFEWAPFWVDWLPPLLALLLISDGGTRRITGANSQQNSLQPRAPKLFPAYQAALLLWCKIFIIEMSFSLGIALANSLHLQEQITSTQECPKSSQATLELTTTFSSASSYLRWRYPPRYRVHSHRYFLQQGLQHFLLYSRVPYEYHASEGRLRAADLPCKANGLFHLFFGITLIAVPTWFPPNDQLSSHMDSSLSLLLCWQVLAMLANSDGYITRLLCAVLSLLLAWQHLLFKTSSRHCLLFLDVTFPDAKILFPEVTYPEVLRCPEELLSLQLGRVPVVQAPARVSSFLPSRTTSLSDWDWTPLWHWNALLFMSELHRVPVVQVIARVSSFLPSRTTNLSDFYWTRLRHAPHLIPVVQVPARVSLLLPSGATFINK